MAGWVSRSVVIAALAAALPAQAAELTNFTFTLKLPGAKSAGPSITGSFSGVLNGNRIDNLTNIFVFNAGEGFKGNGSLFTAQYDKKTREWVAGGHLTLDGSDNNIMFIDTDYATGQAKFYNFIYFVNGLGISVQQPSFRQMVKGDAASALQVEVAPVDGIPEPETWAMLVAGFGLVGGAMRRAKVGRRMPSPA